MKNRSVYSVLGIGFCVLVACTPPSSDKGDKSGENTPQDVADYIVGKAFKDVLGSFSDAFTKKERVLVDGVVIGVVKHTFTGEQLPKKTEDVKGTQATVNHLVGVVVKDLSEKAKKGFEVKEDTGSVDMADEIAKAVKSAFGSNGYETLAKKLQLDYDKFKVAVEEKMKEKMKEEEDKLKGNK